jgi:hypothetical protein
LKRQVIYELDQIFEAIRLAVDSARSGATALYFRKRDEKEERLKSLLARCAALERKLSRRKKVQPLEATIDAAVTRTIRQNSKEFPDLPSARLETEGRKVIDKHLQKLRASLELHMKTEIDSQVKKCSGRN